MKKPLTIATAIALLAGLALVSDTGPGHTQAGGASSMTIGIYAPTVNFKNSAARLQYVQRVAKAIGEATDMKVTGKSYASLGVLKKAKVDFAIIDAQCYAINRRWKLLANGKIDNRSSRRWALYSRVSGGMPGLRGKKITYVRMGCRDKDFILNAMLESEVTASYFSSLVGKPTLTGAVADVASFKAASAVFAPTSESKGLTKVFDTISVPGPAFVQVDSKISSSVVAKVKKAVVGYGGGGEISGWSGANDKEYATLRRQMGKSVKRPLFASPSPVRLPTDVVKDPTTLDDAALTAVKQHFEEPPARQ